MDDTTDFLRAAVHRWGVLLGSAYNVQGGPGVPTPQALGSQALALAVAGTLGAALLTVAFFFLFHSFSSPGDDSAWGALVRGNSSVPPDGSLVVELSHGWTRYKILGQEHPGPLVVLIHGLLGLSEVTRWNDESVGFRARTWFFRGPTGHITGTGFLAREKELN